jgi:hypothetical protein
VISGNYINFAICEYYNDDVFTQLSQLTIKMVAISDTEEMKLYGKVELHVYNMIWSFFSHHLELMFMKFEVPLIKQIVQVVIEGVKSQNSEILASSTNCINAFCEFVHEKLKRKPT